VRRTIAKDHGGVRKEAVRSESQAPQYLPVVFIEKFSLADKANTPSSPAVTTPPPPTPGAWGSRAGLQGEYQYDYV
jgi:hypothetical protein